MTLFSGIVFPADAHTGNPDVSDSAPNATVRSGETDPARSEGGTAGPGLGLEPPYDLASTGDHDQDSGLGLAWRPTGSGVCADRSTTASVSFGASVKCLAAAGDSRVTFFVDSGAGQCLCSVSGTWRTYFEARVRKNGEHIGTQ
jgi:hypothetical protein